MREGFGAHGPYGRDPRQAGACVPLVREIEPETGAGGGFDAGAVFERKQCRIADEKSGIGVREHGDGIGGS